MCLIFEDLLAVCTVFCLCRNKFGNADQVIGDQIEDEVGGDATYAAMFGLARRIVPCCLPQPKMHSITARRDCAIALVPRLSGDFSWSW
jgi:hypothetical protein